MVAELLTGIDEWHAGDNVGEGGIGSSALLAKPLELGAVPRVLIVVAGEVHADSLLADERVLLLEERPKVVNADLALSQLAHRVLQVPAVIHVEGRCSEFLRLVVVLSEGEHIGVGEAEVSHSHFPKIRGHFAGYVATETVDADLVHPEMHCFEHLLTHVFVFVIEFGDIGPVVLHHEVAEAVAIMPALALGPLAIGRGVVGYPVEDDFHAELVGAVDKRNEVLSCAELMIE